MPFYFTIITNFSLWHLLVTEILQKTNRIKSDIEDIKKHMLQYFLIHPRPKYLSCAIHIDKIIFSYSHCRSIISISSNDL